MHDWYGWGVHFGKFAATGFPLVFRKIGQIFSLHLYPQHIILGYTTKFWELMGIWVLGFHRIPQENDTMKGQEWSIPFGLHTKLKRGLSCKWHFLAPSLVAGQFIACIPMLLLFFFFFFFFCQEGSVLEKDEPRLLINDHVSFLLITCSLGKILLVYFEVIIVIMIQWLITGAGVGTSGPWLWHKCAKQWLLVVMDVK